MLNFNVKPYYDDFDETKNYHRILFKPGNAVQARELTQAQTILQNQITKFADHVFAQNSPVSGGKMSVNFKCYYLKLQTTYNDNDIDVNQFNNLLVKNSNGSVLARVIAVVEATSGDPPTLILSYLSGPKFGDNDVVFDTTSNLAARALSVNSTGLSSTAHITQGVFYVLGNFVTNTDSTTILAKYDNTPSVRVGLTITETIQDYIGDSSLLDPAVGASNYQAPGADRYMITLTLSTRTLQFGDDQDFIELLRIEDGKITKKVDSSVYSIIDDYFAKRTYDTNGDYVVNDYSLVPKTNDDPTKYTMTVGKGLAYVRGYRIENQLPVELVSNRSRDTVSQNNVPAFMDYGSYLYVNSLRGANGSIFDVTTTQAIDLHCVPVASINSTNTSTYNATVVSSGYIRSLAFDSYDTQTDANTYIYKAFVNDLKNAVLTANATAGGTATITFPGTFSTLTDAYKGVNISIVEGNSAGDFRTITSYNGATRVATVNSNWTTTPNTTSKFSLNFDVKDSESLVSTNSTFHILSSATLDASGRDGNISTGDPSLQNPTVPEMLYRVGSQYVSNISDTSYSTLQVFRSITFTSSGSNYVAQLPFTGDYVNVIRHFGAGGTTLSSDVVHQNFYVFVTNKGSSNLFVGQQVPWTINGRTVTLNADASIATLTGTSADLGGSFTATVFVKAFVSNASSVGHILKKKNLITANTSKILTSNTAVGNGTYTYVDNNALTSTGQVYIQNAGIVSPGSKQSLYLSDVKRIVKIVDTLNSANVPTVSMLSNTAHDITNNFIFDNGQRDNFYDHASIRLKVGSPKVKGNMLVLVDYYQHTGGDGYFSVMSYLDSSLPENYREIGTYTSKNGSFYNLRDTLDFRPTRLNGEYTFKYRYSDEGDAQKYGTLLPVDLSVFTMDYSYYLGRKDRLVLSRDKSFQIIEGSPSINPSFPTQPDATLLIANITHNPYTGYLPTEVPKGTAPDLVIENIKHKRYTMQDISDIETRINNLEYYTALNALELNTQALQITDAFGLNRFKNGIVVDNFSGYATADTKNQDYYAAINRLEKTMTPTHAIKSFPLKSLDVINTLGSFSESPGYSVDRNDYENIFSLPYTTANVVSQKIASRTFNANPFAMTSTQGTVIVCPPPIVVPPRVVPVVANDSIIIAKPTPSTNANTIITTTNTAPVIVDDSTDSGQICSVWVVDSSLGGEGSGHSDVTQVVCSGVDYNTGGSWKTNNPVGVNSGTSKLTDDFFVMNQGNVRDGSVAAYRGNFEMGVKVDGLLVNAENLVSKINGDDFSAFTYELNRIRVTDPNDLLQIHGIVGYTDPIGLNPVALARIRNVTYIDSATGVKDIWINKSVPPNITTVFAMSFNLLGTATTSAPVVISDGTQKTDSCVVANSNTITVVTNSYDTSFDAANLIGTTITFPTIGQQYTISDAIANTTTHTININVDGTINKPSAVANIVYSLNSYSADEQGTYNSGVFVPKNIVPYTSATAVIIDNGETGAVTALNDTQKSDVSQTPTAGFNRGGIFVSKLDGFTGEQTDFGNLYS